jgi:hypothetical protein
MTKEVFFLMQNAYKELEEFFEVISLDRIKIVL